MQAPCEKPCQLPGLSCAACNAGILLRQLKAAGPAAEAGKGNTLATLTSHVSGKFIDLAVNANSMAKFVKAAERACAYHKELVDLLQSHLISAVRRCGGMLH